MEFALYGFHIYTSELDDHGIDFIARFGSGPFYEVQVKSIRGLNYIFFPKSKFLLSETLLASVVVFLESEAPRTFLIPSTAWREPNPLLADRAFDGLPSKPEFGLNISKKNLPLLERFAFHRTASRLTMA
jgi:hypothetical protein